METSRIFVKGLPPSLTEADFKSHFSSQLPATDVKFFPQRRIGFVGYETPEDAARAVKYFNKTFMRMSRIYVEAARPVPSSSELKSRQMVHTKEHTDLAEHSNSSKKRKREYPSQAPDEKLKEYLEVMEKPSKSSLSNKNQVEQVETATTGQNDRILAATKEDESEGEYQEVRKKSKKEKMQRSSHTAKTARPVDNDIEIVELDATNENSKKIPETMDEASRPGDQGLASDSDWLRSRTSRLLDLEDNEDDENTSDEPKEPDKGNKHQLQNQDDSEEEIEPPEKIDEQELRTTADAPFDRPVEESLDVSAQTSSRLFVRNLAYGVTEDNLEELFKPFGKIDELHVSVDKKTGQGKGFGFVQYVEADSASKALETLDGCIFQGRLLHVLPALKKRENKLDDYAISQLPLKQQQQVRRKMQAASTKFNWNSLYMNADAVLSSVASRLGISKSEFLDPTSSDAAVKQAHAETHVISETKAFFTNNGVDLEAFKKRAKGDTAILVKNFPFGTTKEELRDLFEQHGAVKRLLIPPNGTIAIVEYTQAPEARAAFSSLAYNKFKNSMLFLEKAPKDLFTSTAAANPEVMDAKVGPGSKDVKVSAADLLQQDQIADTAPTATLFVKNLNFSTTTERLRDAFAPLAGFVSATVKTKANTKNPGERLSMGFGFVEFKTMQQAQTALSSMNGYALDGHKLLLRASHKGADAAEERRVEDAAKKAANKGSKIIIKNLPFETTKKDVRAVFGAYGQLRSVRVPRKFDNSARGFAFAEFTTPREAQNAVEALRNTHVLGRRLVLEYAADENEDAEEELERMQKKIGSQLNKVALQKLTGGGRQKFNVAGDDQED